MNHNDYSKQQMNYGVHNKSDRELRAYSNAFLRSLATNLTYGMKHLQYFLLNLIEEGKIWAVAG